MISWRTPEDPKVAEYREQINSKGVFFQRIAVLFFVSIVFLFFVFILPSSSKENLDNLNGLNKNLLDADKKIERLNKKISLKKLKDIIERDFFQNSNQENSENTELLKEFKENSKNLNAIAGKLYDLVIQLEDIDYEKIDKTEEKHIETLKGMKDRANTQLSELKKVNTELKNLKNSNDEKVISAYKKSQENKDEYIALAVYIKNYIDLKLHKIWREKLSSITISLPELSLFGELKSIKLPIPIQCLTHFWSISLFFFLLYWQYTRISILNLYTRLIDCAVEFGINSTNDDLEDFLNKNAEKLLNTRQSNWWWLAPLPRLTGAWLNTTHLKAALGWTKICHIKTTLVLIISVILIVLQFFVLESEFTLVDSFDGIENKKIHHGIELILSLINISVIFFVIFEVDNVFDFKTNQENKVQMQRRAVLRFLALIPPIFAAFSYELMSQPLKVDEISEEQKRNPYHRSHKPTRYIEIDKGNRGFFMNIRNNIVHYMAPVLTPFLNNQINKTRRKPLNKLEKTVYYNRILQWRRQLKSLRHRPKQERIESFKECIATKTRQPNASTLILRDTSPNILLNELQPVNNEEILEILHKKQKMINKGRFVFAIEQHALYNFEHKKDIKYVCDFLLAAIEASKPSLDMLRLLDLLAVLSFRYNQTEIFDKVSTKSLDCWSKTALVEFFERVQTWKSDKWQKKWSSENWELKKRSSIVKWAGVELPKNGMGLPM